MSYEQLDSDAYMRLHGTLDELEIFGAVRRDMLDDPDRALALVDMVRRKPGLKNPAAFAITCWRSGYGLARQPAPAKLAALPDGPPSLSALEYAWSLDPSPASAAFVGLLAAGFGRHGFAAALDDVP